MIDVLDASVALKFVLNQSDSDQARKLRDEFPASLRDFISPDIFAVECAHALTKGERKGTVVDPTSLYNDLMLDAPRFFPSIPLMPRAIEIARKARIAVYDCVYVALAEREGCEMITADQRVIHRLQATFSFITDLATLP
jgi:predicted nucleic acid-binding protein